ncbi:hypothetical protein J4434_08110 [Candidatus Woesearchaeota archaeon]|nr:hypothetical protein [Candidatus Woesearchaeota archaeon]
MFVVEVGLNRGKGGEMFGNTHKNTQKGDPNNSSCKPIMTQKILNI